MKDKAVVWIGLAILFLGCALFLTPISYKMRFDLVPLDLGGVVVLALGTIVLMVGLVSYITGRMQEH